MREEGIVGAWISYYSWRGGASFSLRLLGGFQNLREATEAPGKREHGFRADRSGILSLLGLRRVVFFFFFNIKKFENGGAKGLNLIFLWFFSWKTVKICGKKRFVSPMFSWGSFNSWWTKEGKRCIPMWFDSYIGQFLFYVLISLPLGDVLG